MIRSLSEPPVRVPSGDAARMLALKSDLCARILLEAGRLVRSGQFGAPVKPFTLRARELLDDMDELLGALDSATPVRAHQMAKELRGELERIERAQLIPPRPPAAASSRRAQS